MAEVEFKRGATNHGAVGVAGLDAQILGDLQTGQAAPGTRYQQPVDIGFFQTGIGERGNQRFGLQGQDG